MTLQKAFSERQLAKAKYLKRWKGKDGKWKYKYKQEKKQQKKSEPEKDSSFAYQNPFQVIADEYAVTRDDLSLMHDISGKGEDAWTDNMSDEELDQIDVLVEKGLVELKEEGHGERTVHLTKKGSDIIYKEVRPLL